MALSESRPRDGTRDAPVRLLVVEDDPNVAAGVVRGLRVAGFDVELAVHGGQARELLSGSKPPDLVVLDLMLPEVTGFDLLESLSGKQHPPIIVLTARTCLEERLRCFSLGVVDYVPKPFFLDELIARIRARLRIATVEEARVVEFGDVKVDLDARSLTVCDQLVVLTRYEFDLLAYLVERPGRAVSREQLATRALAGLEGPEPRTIDTHIARVRKKLGARAALAIGTVWGIGYRFDPERAEI